jgi:hypothetical protein
MVIVFTEPKAAILFHSFILAYFLFLGFSIWLNTISSNYVMVASIIITPLVAIFFEIFHKLVSTTYFPLWIIIPSLLLSIVSTILWIYGEKNNFT